MTPLSPYLNHRFTLKTSFIAAVVLCIADLLLAALAVNFPMLMIARILQGAGTGVALPLMFNIILEQSPRSRLDLLMGVGNMVCAIAPALGPTVGGVGAAAIGWRWMFGVLLDRFGPMRPILSTMALAIVGILLMLLLVRPSSSVWMICVGYIAYMVGFSMAYANTMTAGMGVIPVSMQPDGNAMFSTFQQLAGAVGTMVMSICLGVAQSGHSITVDKAAFAAATQRGGHAAWRPCGSHRATGCDRLRVPGEPPRLRCAPNGMTAGFFFT